MKHSSKNVIATKNNVIKAETVPGAVAAITGGTGLYVGNSNGLSGQDTGSCTPSECVRASSDGGTSFNNSVGSSARRISIPARERRINVSYDNGDNN